MATDRERESRHTQRKAESEPWKEGHAMSLKMQVQERQREERQQVTKECIKKTIPCACQSLICIQESAATSDSSEEKPIPSNSASAPCDGKGQKSVWTARRHGLPMRTLGSSTLILCAALVAWKQLHGQCDRNPPFALFCPCL